MDHYFRIRRLVDEDIDTIQKTLKAYSHDGDTLERLFEKLLTRHGKNIEGFDAGLSPMVPGEDNTSRAATCRQNIGLLLSRLLAFQKNNYENAGPDADVTTGRQMTMAFNAARIQVEQMPDLIPRMRQEILDKLDEIEEICIGLESSAVKWNKLRPYLMWLSGKSAPVGFLILPLMLMIVGKKGEYDA